MSKRGMFASILIVLLGGVFALAGTKALVKHTSVLVVARAVTAGATITDADLATTDISPNAELHAIDAADRRTIVGQVAATNLNPGILTMSMIGPNQGFVPGQVIVAIALKAGQAPTMPLTVGEHVQVVGTPGTNVAAPAVGAPDATPASFSAVVATVGVKDTTTNVTVVDLRVPQADGPGVARLNSTGNLALIVLPAGG